MAYPTRDCPVKKRVSGDPRLLGRVPLDAEALVTIGGGGGEGFSYVEVRETIRGRLSFNISVSSRELAEGRFTLSDLEVAAAACCAVWWSRFSSALVTLVVSVLLAFIASVAVSGELSSLVAGAAAIAGGVEGVAHMARAQSFKRCYKRVKTGRYAVAILSYNPVAGVIRDILAAASRVIAECKGRPCKSRITLGGKPYKASVSRFRDTYRVSLKPEKPTRRPGEAGPGILEALEEWEELEPD